MDVKEERGKHFLDFQNAIDYGDWEQCHRLFIYLMTTIPNTNPLFKEFDMNVNDIRSQYDKRIQELNARDYKTSSPSESNLIQDEIWSLVYDKWLSTYVFLKQKFLEHGLL